MMSYDNDITHKPNYITNTYIACQLKQSLNITES